MSLYIIESRRPDGSLDLSGRQPEEAFGMRAITGIDEHAIAQAVWRHQPGAVLTGDAIAFWPSIIDPRWRAREKTW